MSQVTVYGDGGDRQVTAYTGNNGRVIRVGVGKRADQIAFEPTQETQSTNLQDAIEEMESELIDRINDATGTPTYRRTFTNADLSIANLLPVTHGMGLYPTAVSIWDGNRQLIWPDDIDYIDANSISIDFSSFAPIDGTWTLAVGG